MRKYTLKKFERISGQSGLVQIDGSESQNGIRWTAEAIYAGYRPDGLIEAVEACDRGGWYTRHPGTDEVCQIDDYMGLAWICSMLNRKDIARKWLWYGVRRGGFYGPIVFRNWMPRYIALTIAMLVAAFPLLKRLMKPLSSLVVRIGLNDIIDRFGVGENHHDGYALTYQFMEIVPPYQWLVREFTELMRTRFGGDSPRQTYGKMLVDWNSIHWGTHPTVELLIRGKDE